MAEARSLTRMAGELGLGLGLEGQGQGQGQGWLGYVVRGGVEVSASRVRTNNSLATCYHSSSHHYLLTPYFLPTYHSRHVDGEWARGERVGQSGSNHNPNTLILPSPSPNALTLTLTR